MQKSFLFTLLFSLLLLAIGCRSVRAPQTPTGPNFRILTYNVNWGEPNPEAAAQIIRQTKAEIVCLQETTPAWEKYLRQTLAHEYPYMEFRTAASRAAGGLGFLSKQPRQQISYIPSDSGWFDGWIMAFETPLGAVQVLNVHLQPPVNRRGSFGLSGLLGTGNDRLREIKRFYAQRRSELPLVIAGDFNAGEGSSAVDWLRENGMRNGLPEFDRHTSTWRWRLGFLTLHRRMDHILYSPQLHCFEAKVIRAGASDHFPVTAVFGLEQDHAHLGK